MHLLRLAIVKSETETLKMPRINRNPQATDYVSR